MVSITCGQQPNIILIESDDQNNWTVNGYGNEDIQTPALDRLMERGTSFMNACNMGAWRTAVCVPSRTMLHHGVFVWEAEDITWEAGGTPGKSLTERLRDEGYETWFTGKWHVQGISVAKSFQNVGTVWPGQVDSYWTNDGHVTDITGDEAVQFVKDAAGQDKPFFLFVSFNAPHTPRETHQRFFDMYPPASLTLPPSVKEGDPNPDITWNYSPKRITLDWARKENQSNYAMITHMDEQIGRILD